MENEQEYKPTGELSEEELQNIAGGDCKKGDKTVVSALNSCDYWICKHCGNADKELGLHDCIFKDKVIHANCGNCRYCKYEKALWLCDRANMERKE